MLKNYKLKRTENKKTKNRLQKTRIKSPASIPESCDYKIQGRSSDLLLNIRLPNCLVA